MQKPEGLQIRAASYPKDPLFFDAARIFSTVLRGADETSSRAVEYANRLAFRRDTKDCQNFIVQAAGFEIAAIGSLKLRKSAFGFAELRSIAVVEDFQGQGIGGGLISFLEAQAIEAGAPGVMLVPTSGAVEMYRHLGYETGTTREMFKRF